jgi:hypothetical protein
MRVSALTSGVVSLPVAYEEKLACRIDQYFDAIEKDDVNEIGRMIAADSSDPDMFCEASVLTAVINLHAIKIFSRMVDECKEYKKVEYLQELMNKRANVTWMAMLAKRKHSYTRPLWCSLHANILQLCVACRFFDGVRYVLDNLSWADLAPLMDAQDHQYSAFGIALGLCVPEVGTREINRIVVPVYDTGASVDETMLDIFLDFFGCEFGSRAVNHLMFESTLPYALLLTAMWDNIVLFKYLVNRFAFDAWDMKIPARLAAKISICWDTHPGTLVKSAVMHNSFHVLEYLMDVIPTSAEKRAAIINALIHALGHEDQGKIADFLFSVLSAEFGTSARDLFQEQYHSASQFRRGPVTVGIEMFSAMENIQNADILLTQPNMSYESIFSHDSVPELMCSRYVNRDLFRALLLFTRNGWKLSVMAYDAHFIGVPAHLLGIVYSNDLLIEVLQNTSPLMLFKMAIGNTYNADIERLESMDEVEQYWITNALRFPLKLNATIARCISPSNPRFSSLSAFIATVLGIETLCKIACGASIMAVEKKDKHFDFILSNDKGQKYPSPPTGIAAVAAAGFAGLVPVPFLDNESISGLRNIVTDVHGFFCAEKSMLESVSLLFKSSSVLSSSSSSSSFEKKDEAEKCSFVRKVLSVCVQQTTLLAQRYVWSMEAIAVACGNESVPRMLRQAHENLLNNIEIVSE